MRLLRLIFAHPGLKLLSLFLAWGLWYAFRADAEEQADATIRVVAEADPDSGVEGTPLVKDVDVRIRGSRRDVAAIESGGRPLVARVTAKDLDVDQLTGNRAFRPDELHFPAPIAPGAVRIVEMTPQVVTVRVVRVERRQLPLAPPEFPPPEETGVQIEVRKLPPQVWIRAPVEQLQTMLDVKTVVDREQLLHHIETMGDAIRTTATLQLRIAPSQADVITLIEPRTIDVLVELIRVGEQSVLVPLVVMRDAAEPPAPGAGQPDAAAPPRVVLAATNKPWVYAGPEPSVQIILRGSRDALAAADPRRIRAFLLVSDVPRGATKADLPLHVADLPPGVALDRTDYAVSVEVLR